MGIPNGCPGLSEEQEFIHLLQRALADLRKSRKLTCLKREPDAEW